MTTTHSVDELIRAARALDSGRFRGPRVAASPGDREGTAHSVWARPESVLAVAGVTGRVGATTTALAIAEAAEGRARLVDVSRMHASGLAAAASAELGVSDSGWRRGKRGDLVLERASRDWAGLGQIPTPDASDREITILDVGRDLVDVLGSRTWLEVTVREVPLVLVTAATTPALCRLDMTLGSLRRASGVAVVVVGLSRRRWPKRLTAALTPRVKDLEASGALTVISPSNELTWGGLTSDPLPPTLLRLAAPIAADLLQPSKGPTS